MVLICYPVNAFGQEKALRSFICTDTCLVSDQEILALYSVRWEIEVYFRNCKTKLAFDKYQIRSAKGIKRFWLITSLAYLLACYTSNSYDFSDGYTILQSVVCGFATAVGFTIAIVILAGLREKMQYNDIPAPFKGMPLVLLTSGLMAIAFTGFSALK